MKFFKKYSFLILVIFHLVGLLGISLIDREIFAALTPLNLLLSAFLVVKVHQVSPNRLSLFFLVAFVGGYLVELLGTQTGFPFGNYEYGPALGPKIFEVPIIIGLNWFLMLMGTGYLSRRMVANPVGQVLIASVFMTLVDLAIEPIAPQLDYWYWNDGEAPFMNYLGWFGVSIIMHTVFQFTVKEQTNRLAVPYILILSIFFVTLNLTL